MVAHKEFCGWWNSQPILKNGKGISFGRIIHPVCLPFETNENPKRWENRNVDVVGFATFQKGVIVQGAGSTTTTLNVTGVSTLGVTSVSTFTAKGTLIEGMSSTTTAYSSSSDLNITNGNFQFSSANLAGTNNTLNIMDLIFSGNWQQAMLELHS